MTRVSKDVRATVLVALAVLVFFATHQGWGVPLVGDSHRWAAVVVGLLGMGTCALGSPANDTITRVLAALGVVALVLAVLAIATGSLTPLSLLAADIVLLWALSTLRHTQARHRPVVT
jgi:peptidoglycan/LPS O-acetylase OafA/YrhL